MKVRKAPQSGKLGDIVAKRNRYGQYEMKLAPQKNRRTPARRRARQRMSRFARMWAKLTEEQRTGWRERAVEVQSRRRLAQSGPLTGQTLFIKLNVVLALCGEEPLLDAPPIAWFRVNPVAGLAITNGKEGFALRLVVSEAPKQGIMVFGSPPRSVGRMSTDTYTFLGMLPAGIEWKGEITSLYVRKYGVPPAGTRVFIRTWPMENGWEGKKLARIASAVVPARGRGRGG